jgi:protein-S-isoprenylcysteine O-methyltransferase Ste14
MAWESTYFVRRVAARMKMKYGLETAGSVLAVGAIIVLLGVVAVFFPEQLSLIAAQLITAVIVSLIVLGAVGAVILALYVWAKASKLI